MKCDYCKINESVGVYSYDFGPVSLSCCQQCLETKNLRTNHHIHMVWLTYGDKVFDLEGVVFYKGNYIKINEYLSKITVKDILEYYDSESTNPLKIKLIEKIVESE